MVLSAPADVTVRKQEGVWSLNRKLSDENDEILKLQKVGWLLRKAMGLSSLTVKIAQWVDEAGVANLKITTIASGGLSSEETWQIDGVERDNASNLFGPIRAKLSYVTKEQIQDDYQKEGWDADCTEFVQTILTSKEHGWVADSVSGYVTIDGVKRNARRIVVRSGSEICQARLFYDYVGPLPAE